MEMDEFSCWCFIEVKQKKIHNGNFQLKKKTCENFGNGHVGIERWSLNQTHVFTIYESSNMFTNNSMIFRITYSLYVNNQY
jgi:hypothetical protein